MQRKITIIGAGISGLYLAYLLEDRFQITLLEARERTGGRIFSIEGHDMGPSWVWSHQRQMLQLLSRLGLELFIQHTEGDALYDRGQHVERFVPPPPAPSARVTGSLTRLTDKLRYSLKNTKIVFSQKAESVTHRGDKLVVDTMTDRFSSDFVIVALPPRLASKIAFDKKLPEPLRARMAATPTWMGHTAKCVIEFQTPFWREKGLSGFVFSHSGPLGEIHDASTATKHALFGFVSANAKMARFTEDLEAQLQRVFGVDRSQINAIHLMDWREEPYTASPEERTPLQAHPAYGIDTSGYSDKILFSATEFSFEEGGYLEGALLRAQEIARQLRSQVPFFTKTA